ncbi:immunoglobulin domain-containing protein [Cellulomonas fengjieae]|uniref:Ig-like domain-containing protein n=1 Tax=Cellulomonas fengjieae TaxID=2819978 RepID=A0ABS3SBC1_9CELL|nr:immunoglobulin domain-containing protein [Cellulomonas fengjieae]MBO3083043.1 hypothetical protein [Cellulomonas fengjieae]QVI65585.1 hypothetical protein KG102_16050 [Cellulomonas fengjieae]
MLPTTRARARQGTRTSAFARGIAALLAVGLTAGLVTLAATPAAASEVTTTYTGAGFVTGPGGGTNSGQSSIVVPAGTGSLRSMTLNLVGNPQPAPVGLQIQVGFQNDVLINCGTGGTCALPPRYEGRDPAGRWILFVTVGWDGSQGDVSYNYGGFTVALTTEVADLAITTHPANVSTQSGTAVTLTSAATGHPTPAVQWQVDSGTGFANVPGATSPSYTVTPTYAQSGYKYQAVYSSAQGTVTTNPATLTVLPLLPVVTSDPVSTTVTEGAPASFSAGATPGDPAATVQWEVSLDGGATFVGLAGATASTHTIAPATRAQHLLQYRAVFLNAAGTRVATAAATLRVQYGPEILTPPTDVDIPSGGTATFWASAAGNPTPTVQWQISTDGEATFTDIAGATEPTLVLVDRRYAHTDTFYRAVFTNGVVSRTTDAARLSVDSIAPDVTTVPLDQRVVAGTPVTFTSAATGDPAPTVQWWVSSDRVSFVKIVGATADSYTFTATAQDDGNWYRADYQNALGSYYWGQAAYLTVGVAPVVTAHPTDQTVVAGTRATFTSTITSQPGSEVQWQASTDGGVSFTDIPDATYSTLELDGLTFADSGTRYRAVHTNWVDSATTDPAILTVTAALPVVTTDIADQEVLAGTPVTFTAAATGDPTPTVQWRRSTDGGRTFSDIAGATSDSYTFTAAAADDRNQYAAVYTNVGGWLSTSVATLAVNVAPVVSLDPVDQTASEDTVATFTTGATGQPAPRVQWQVSTNGGLTFTDIQGAMASTLSVPAEENATGNRYRAVHTNVVGAVVTDDATLTVLPLADIVTQPTAQALRVGARATFTARSDDPAATIQWQVSADGGRTFTDLPGEVGGELTFLTTTDQDGNLYRALFTTTAGTTSTTPVALTLDAAVPAPAAPTAPAATGTVAVDVPRAARAAGAALAVTGADSGLLALAAALLLATGAAATVIGRRRHAAR